MCEKKRMEAVELNCLRNICGHRRIDKVPNVEIKRCEKNVSVSQRVDKGVLRWFGHVANNREYAPSLVPPFDNSYPR